MRTNIMNIQSYQDYFHDGSVEKFVVDRDRIEIWMESCELLPEWGIKNIVLSDAKTIRGRLILKGASSICINGEEIKDLKFKLDTALLLDLEVEKDSVALGINWVKYKTEDKPMEIAWELIVIKAAYIEWQVIPDLYLTE